MSQGNTEVCAACGVKILRIPTGDRVLFSVGPPGTRATLWARVCQFTQKPGCINKDRDAVGEIKPNDYYQAEP